MVAIAIVLVVAVAALVALLVVRPRLERGAELDDPPGVRSALVFALDRDAPPQVRSSPGPDADPALVVPSPEVLDAIAASLEAAGADVSRWQASGAVLELEGLVGESAFKLTIGALEPGAFLLVVHARTLGRRRWVAPPPTEAMRSVLLAVDRGVRRAPGVRGLAWRRRQHGAAAERPQSAPVD